MSSNPSPSNERLGVFVDGACLGNPGPGGWGVHFVTGKDYSGHHPDTTNNRMELQAAIEALTLTPKDQPLVVFTDSQYVQKGITGWLEGWKKNGWKNAAKKPVKNVDLWKALDALNAERDVDWVWVKGHSGIEGNEIADRLANEACINF